jgi:hypothetical protein
MPAWMAGIQVRRMRPANIHVSLGSSTPCWNDEIEGLRERRGWKPCPERCFEYVNCVQSMTKLKRRD